MTNTTYHRLSSDVPRITEFNTRNLMLLVAKLTKKSFLCHLCVMGGDSGFGNGNPIGNVQCPNQATYQKTIRGDVSYPIYIHALYIPRIQSLVSMTVGSEIRYNIQNIQHKKYSTVSRNSPNTADNMSSSIIMHL
jgi:hypothetical protein